MTLKVYKLLTLIGPTSPSFTDFSCSFVRRKQLLLLSSLSSKKKRERERNEQTGTQTTNPPVKPANGEKERKREKEC